MKSCICWLMVLCTGAFVSGAEAEVRTWSAGESREIASKLFTEMQVKGARSNGVMLGEWGTHTAAITVRSGDGAAELHRDIVDFFLVLEGEATLVTGGKLVAAAEKSPGEWRAATITGGAEKQLKTGDIVYIPAGVPHQLLVKTSFRYYVIKARAQEAAASPSTPARAGSR